MEKEKKIKRKQKTFFVYLSYGHDVDNINLIKVKARDKQHAYFKTVDRYERLKGKDFLEKVFRKKGIIYSPYGYVSENKIVNY